MKETIHYSGSHYTILMPFHTLILDNVPTCCSTSNLNWINLNSTPLQTEEQQKLTEFGKYLLYFTNQFSLPTPGTYSDRNPESDQAAYKTIYLRFLLSNRTIPNSELKTLRQLLLFGLVLKLLHLVSDKYSVRSIFVEHFLLAKLNILILVVNKFKTSQNSILSKEIRIISDGLHYVTCPKSLPALLTTMLPKYLEFRSSNLPSPSSRNSSSTR